MRISGNENKEIAVFEDSFSEEVWKSTYKHHSDKTVSDTFRRVAMAISSVEKNESLRNQWNENFVKLFSNFSFVSGGRILSNAGTEWKGTTLINCFVGTKSEYDQDSLEGIFETLLAQAKTLKSEGGWGMNFSFIRPRGSFIHGIGVETPGAVKYMELFDKSSDIITSGSGKKTNNKKAKGKIRKGAMMGVLSCWHPDIHEFITAKLQEGRLSKFNISVDVSNKFMDKIIKVKSLIDSGASEDEIKKEDSWDLIFPDTTHERYKTDWDGDIEHWQNLGYPIVIYETISAMSLWKQIIQSTYDRNDPGVLFLDIANKTHGWNYGGREANIKATNPCGEQTLPFGAVCDLGSLNLTQFIDYKNNSFDLKKIEEYTKYAVRFLDNVNDYTSAPLEKYEKSIKYRRRIGLGIMGWASSLYLLGVRFASDEAEEIKKEVMKTITHTAINYSIDLAKEKGKFIGCEPKEHVKNIFWDQIGLTRKTKRRMKKYGLRNSALFSIQPTGNTSILSNIVSGGLEPIFMNEYIRTVIVNEVPDHIKDFCPKYWEGEFVETEMFKWSKEGNDNILIGKDKIGTVYKIDRNRGLTKEVLCEDYAVRKLKSQNKWDKDADWAVTTTELSVSEHIKDMQGFGKYIDSSMSKTINVPNDYPFEDFENVYLDAYKTGFLKGITTYRAGTMTTVLSAVKEEKKDDNEEIREEYHAPKRPNELPCDVHHCSVKGEKYFVMIGLLEGRPYELFAGKNGFIPRQVISATIKKIKRGHYQAWLDNGEIIENISEYITEDQEGITRLTSLALRHGNDLPFLVHQLEKTKGEMTSFAKAISRQLKKYIPDGTKIKGEECPECFGSLHRQEGCVLCGSCGWTKCS